MSFYTFEQISNWYDNLPIILQAIIFILLFMFLFGLFKKAIKFALIVLSILILLIASLTLFL